MSYPFHQGGFTSIEDQPEHRPNNGLRKTKRDDMQSRSNVPHASKRAALGTITNQTRVQPFRAAKQGVVGEGYFAGTQDENSKAKSAFSVSNTFNTQTFSIHVDDEPKIQRTQNVVQKDVASSSGVKLELNSAVTSLHPLSRSFPPVEVINIDDSTDSPMVLDVSIEERPQLSTKEERDAVILTVPEYSADIYKYLREAELKNRPKPEYMRKQPDITNSMRCILVDWLVEVAEEYKLHRETLCLAVNYIDRFLSHMSVLRGKLQLVGAASMFLAAKFEEIYPPEVGEFVYITDDTYTKKQVLRMEHLILKVLSFDVAVPTVNCFCERFLKQSNADDKTQSLAMFLTELSLVDADQYLKFLPSVIAASAVCLANSMLGNEPWPTTLYQSSGYTLNDLQSCLATLHRTLCNAPNHPQQAVREKYRTSKFHQVSTMSPPMSYPKVNAENV